MLITKKRIIEIDKYIAPFKKKEKLFEKLLVLAGI